MFPSFYLPTQNSRKTASRTSSGHHRDRDGGKRLGGAGRLPYVITGYVPMAVRVEHRGDCLDGGLLVLEGALVLNHDVLAVGRSGQARLIARAPWRLPFPTASLRHDS